MALTQPFDAPVQSALRPAQEPRSPQVAVRQQSFSVEYQFPVIFCRGVFDLDNRVLVDIMSQFEPRRRHRILVFVDDGVSSTRPSLSGEIMTFAERHAHTLELVAQPITVSGGE